MYDNEKQNTIIIAGLAGLALILFLLAINNIFSPATNVFAMFAGGISFLLRMEEKKKGRINFIINVTGIIGIFWALFALIWMIF